MSDRSTKESLSASKRGIVNELHRQARKKFVRRKVFVRGIDDLWQADLIEMIPYARINGGKKYVLMVIDALSKYAWAVALNNKAGKTVASALESVIEGSGRIPRNIQSDLGTDFYNKEKRHLSDDEDDDAYVLSDDGTKRFRAAVDPDVSRQKVSKELDDKLKTLQDSDKKTSTSLVSLDDKLKKLKDSDEKTSTRLISLDKKIKKLHESDEKTSASLVSLDDKLRKLQDSDEKTSASLVYLDKKIKKLHESDGKTSESLVSLEEEIKKLQESDEKTSKLLGTYDRRINTLDESDVKTLKLLTNIDAKLTVLLTTPKLSLS
ncbi:uncharacterized protein LOC128995807 [Macrosteles quadrilineatus]|uniref:uncharacterized protein LOC128995807 n=1 Tax=Macrosteles quadrilineatus TaxID=74068 RepID=UPI0023E21502|nr:uncharacterized protein LOC128995807 [Macrosteles quadrilineatus]